MTTDLHRRPMTRANVKSPTYYAPGAKYVTAPDGATRRVDLRPLDVAINSQDGPRGPRLTLRQAWRYVKAEASAAIRGPVSDQVYQARMAQCVACPKREANDLDGIGFCGACGCGHGPRAALTVKGRMPEAKCPLDPPKWGAEKGAGPTFGSVGKGIRGVAQTVRYVVRRARPRVPVG